MKTFERLMMIIFLLLTMQLGNLFSKQRAENPIQKVVQTKTVYFTLKEDAFAFWDDSNKKWKVEKGEFEIMIAKSSSDIILKKIIKITNI